MPPGLEQARTGERTFTRSTSVGADLTPAEGEDFYAWITRSLKGINSFSREAALRELLLKEVDPGHLQEVSQLLVVTLDEAGTHTDKHLEAMLRWRTTETEGAILRLGGSPKVSFHRTAFMNALVKLESREAARALASGLTDFRSGDDVVPRLIEMGPVAEEFVVTYLSSSDARVRRRAYVVLTEIGGEESVAKLKSVYRLERDAALKKLATDTYETVNKRVRESKPPVIGTKK